MTGDLLERIRGWRCPTHLARDPFVELSDLLTGKGGGLMFYFGCGEESGHFLFDADAHRVPRHHIPRDFPFGNYDDPADEDEPVTEDWLVSIGFFCDQYGIISASTDRLCLTWFGQGAFGCDHVPFEAKTRGDVRRLCRALGVEVK